MTAPPAKKKRGRPAGKPNARRAAPSATGTAEDNVTLVKKYGNRRLYDTRRSRYVTLEDLTELLAKGEEMVVVDATSGEDVTKRVLTQMILQEEEDKDQNILPVAFLKKLLQNRDEGVRDYIQKYLTASFDTWLSTQKTVGNQLQGLAGAAMDPRMLANFFPWLAGMTPPQQGPGPMPPPTSAAPSNASTPPPAAPGAPRVADELQELRARLAELEKQYRKE
jgi:polyhydroxyalkanoate synthesis repressor PhaR